MFTGPLPEAVNYRKLAADSGVLAGTIALEKFTRFTELLASVEGVVQVKLEFRKGKKRSIRVVGRATAELTLVCQNCLAELKYELEAKFQHFIVENEQMLLDLAENEDAIVCDEDKISLAAIIEDELIISVPMVSRHPDGACEPLSGHQNDESPAEPKTHRPFAGLAELKNELSGLKRS